MGVGLIKEGGVFWIKSIDLEDVLIIGRSRIHQSKSWYQTSQVVLFAKIVSGYKLLTFFVKSSNLDVLLVP